MESGDAFIVLDSTDKYDLKHSNEETRYNHDEKEIVFEFVEELFVFFRGRCQSGERCHLFGWGFYLLTLDLLLQLMLCTVNAVTCRARVRLYAFA